MPDKNGNLTRLEIENLKQEAETLIALDKNFTTQEKLGMDVSKQREMRDNTLAEIRRMIQVYEPLVEE